jgi:hypothetical protein
MKAMVMTVAAALTLAACTQQGQEPVAGADTNAATPQRPSEAETEAYLSESEQEWAALATKKDPSVLERILADDYVGVSGSGETFNKSQEIKDESEQPDTYITATVPVMTYRHFGDTVLAQGQQTLNPKGGGAPVKILWTDVWMFRDGKWQVVGSQNAVVPPKP